MSEVQTQVPEEIQAPRVPETPAPAPQPEPIQVNAETGTKGHKKVVKIKKAKKEQTNTPVPKPAVGKNVTDAIWTQLCEETGKLGLTVENHQSRMTYQNGSRVCAFERGKRQVTIHLPRSLGKAETPLKRTYDKRGYGYVRVSTLEQVPVAMDLIRWAKEHNND